MPNPWRKTSLVWVVSLRIASTLLVLAPTLLLVTGASIGISGPCNKAVLQAKDCLSSDEEAILGLAMGAAQLAELCSTLAACGTWFRGLLWFFSTTFNLIALFCLVMANFSMRNGFLVFWLFAMLLEGIGNGLRVSMLLCDIAETATAENQAMFMQRRLREVSGA